MNKLIILLSLTILLTSLAGCTAVCPDGNHAEFMVDDEIELVNLINAERAKAGIAPLTRTGPNSENLRKAAGWHSYDMACKDYCDHDSPTGKTPEGRLADLNVSYRAMGEDIACNPGTPSAVVSGWMASTGHREIMLSPDYNEVGVMGVHKAGGSKYQYYWTAVFIGQ